MKYDPHGYVVTQDQEDNAGETGLHGLTRTSDSEAGVWGGDNEVESGLHISDLLLYKVAGDIGHNNRKKM